MSHFPFPRAGLALPPAKARFFRPGHGVRFLLLLLGLLASFRAPGQDSNLVTWLKFDDGAGTVATDASGRGNSGSLVNMADANRNWFFGRYQGALNLDGSNDYVSISNCIGDDFTISLWVQTTQTMPTSDYAYGGNGLVWSDVSGSANDFVLGLTRSASGINRVSFFTGNPDTPLNGTSEISDGWWKHIAVTRDKASGALKLYVNGLLEAQGTGGTNSLRANAGICLGGNPLDGRYFRGNLDDLRLYNRVLTPTQIAGLASLLPTNLLAGYFQFTNTAGPRTLQLAGNLDRAVANVTTNPAVLAKLNERFGRAISDCTNARAMYEASTPSSPNFGFTERSQLCDAAVFYGIARRAQSAGAAVDAGRLNTLSNEVLQVTLALTDALKRSGSTNVTNQVGQGAIMEALAVLYDWNWDNLNYTQRTNIVDVLLRYSIIPNFNAVLALATSSDHQFWATEELGNWTTIMSGGPIFCALAIRQSDYDGSFSCWNGLGTKVTRSLREHFDAYLPVALSMFHYGYDFLERSNGTMHEGTGYHHDCVFALFGVAASLEGALQNRSNPPAFLQEFAQHTRIGAAYHVNAGLHFASPAGGEFTYNDGTWWLTTEPVNFLVAEWARQQGSPLWRGGAWQALERTGTSWSGLDLLWNCYFDWSASTNTAAGMKDFDPASLWPGVLFYRSKTAYHGQAGSDEFITIWRQRWHDPEAAGLMFKGGDKRKALHDHLDTGTFHYDAEDIRWTAELGSAGGYPSLTIGGKSTGYQTYPTRAMAHNTLVINPTRNDYVNGAVHPLWTEANPDQAVEDGISEHWAPVTLLQTNGAANVWSASVNLSPAYARHGIRSQAQGAPDDSRRWFDFDRTTGEVVIHDKLYFAQPNNEVYWYMHVGASTAAIYQQSNHILLQAMRPDGRPAYLSVRLEALDAAVSSGLQYVTPLEYLPGEQPTNLWTFNDADVKTNNFRKLALRSVASGTSLECSVRLQPHPELTGQSAFTALLKLGLVSDVANYPGEWPLNGTWENCWDGLSLCPSNAPGFSTDAVEGSRSLGLNGLNQYAATAGAMDLGAKFTVATWLKLAAGRTNSQIIAANDQPGQGAGFKFYVNSPKSADGALVLETASGGALSRIATAPGLISPNTWTHVAAVVDRAGGSARLFVNGTNCTGTDQVQTSFSSAGVVYLGAAPQTAPEGFFGGLLDDVRIVPRALSVPELKALLLPNLSQRWTFNVDGSEVTGRGPEFTPQFGAMLARQARIGVQSLYFDGYNDCAVSAAPVSLANAFTFAAWVNIAAGRYSMQTILCNRVAGGSANGLFLYANSWHTSDQKLILETSNGSTAVSLTTATNALAFGDWVHVTATVDRGAGQARLYLNGELAASGSIRNDFQITNTLVLGSLGPVNGDGRYAQNLQGSLEDVRLYCRVLTAAEVKLLSGPTDLPPALTSFVAGSGSAVVGTPINFSAEARDPDTPEPLRYSFDWGDGTAPTPWSATKTAVHAYNLPGSYTALARVDDGTSLTTSPLALSIQPGLLPPVLSLSDLPLMAGASLLVTNYAADPGSPPQRLLFSLLSAPAGATINATNGQIGWRPTLAQAGTTNLFTVVATQAGWLTNLSPVADTYVRDGSYANSNFGTAATLETKLSPSVGSTRETYLRFALGGVNGGIVSAKLQLWPIGVSLPGTHAVGVVTNDAWDETTLTWNNRPASSGAWATWVAQPGVPTAADVTKVAKQELAGDRVLSLRVFGTNSTADGLVSYGSREGALTNAPALVLISTNDSSLSATQSFRVVVAAPPPPTLQAAEYVNQRLTFRITGALGPDYTIEVATNLPAGTNWWPLYRTNSPALPLLWTDPDTNGWRQKFYRVLLGP